jgi:hypothetical protein
VNNFVRKNKKMADNHSKEVRNDNVRMFNCRIIEQARKKRTEMIEEYGDIAEATMKTLYEGF